MKASTKLLTWRHLQISDKMITKITKKVKNNSNKKRGQTNHSNGIERMTEHITNLIL